ncbi:uncharacterized protein LOC116417661 [Nasonia vitripennis]|uniref:Uncharacterized protein n=1 Tax=Nasonia vitripennis TaxID=7425 RepID=A0A7M7QHN8_NASVI|nr:uncharacterized protein LOC116417661 [Nasonia vitripennis]
MKNKNKLRHWLLLIQELYPLKSMTYYVHQLLHITKNINDWGPLWAHTAFYFEAANHNLLTAIHSSRGVILHILRYTNLRQHAQILEEIVYPDCSPCIKYYCENILQSKSQKIYKISEITYFGKGKSIDQRLLNQLNVSPRTNLFQKLS